VYSIHSDKTQKQHRDHARNTEAQYGFVVAQISALSLSVDPGKVQSSLSQGTLPICKLQLLPDRTRKINTSIESAVVSTNNQGI